MTSGISLALEGARVARGGTRGAMRAADLRIEAGEQLALIGPSGAGKTTMLAVLGAALEPDAGRVLIDGHDPWRLSGPALRRLRARLFTAPQTPPLPPRQRVVTAVLAGRLPHWSLVHALASLWHPSEAAAAHDALAQFSLGDKLWSRVDRLSGGERQRVSLARALVAQAGAYFIDEPLAALDPALADRTLEVLMAGTRRHGATLVCSLHHVSMALAHFPRVIGLRDGEIVFDRAPSDIAPEEIDRLYYGEEAARSEAPGAVMEPDARIPRPSRCA
ncbi:MAG: ATP-binding cassette domain-containing protein [Burkholderiaceae bacterium]|nr:ATP-binding cassette domain-containing protein [Burkholderiaceae bacterium]